MLLFHAACPVLYNNVAVESRTSDGPPHILQDAFLFSDCQNFTASIPRAMKDHVDSVRKGHSFLPSMRQFGVGSSP